MGFEVHREESETAVLLRASGDVDLNTTPDLLKSMKTAFKSRKHEVVLDLTHVSHMDSSGIAVLVEGVRDSKRTGKRFLLAHVPKNVLGVIELAKLQNFFQYHET